MKILSHFAVLLDKLKAQKKKPVYWQDKYIGFIENLPFPSIEVYKQEIIYFNKLARNIFNIDNFAQSIPVADLFKESLEIDKINEKSFFQLHLKNESILFNASVLNQFSANNYILSLNIDFPKTSDNLKTDIFKGLFDNSLEGIILLDDKGIIIEWNQAMSDIFEVPREKYLYKPVWQLDYDFIPSVRKTEELKKTVQKTINDYLQNASSEVHIEDYEKEINNKIKYLHYRVFPIITENRKLFGRVNLDFTNRKIAELEIKRYQEHLELLVHERSIELQKSETRLQLLLKSLPLAYYSYDIQNPEKRTWYGENLEILGGYRKEDYNSNSYLWFSLIHQEDKERVKEAFDQIVNKGHLNCEYRWITSNNKVIWILDQAVLINQEETDSKQIIGCILDITEHKESEKAIIENERNYREIFNSSSDAIFIHNLETGKIEDVNDTVLKMYQCDFNDVLKYDLVGFSSSNSLYNRENALKQIEIAKYKGIHKFEWIGQRKDGTTFWAEIILKLIKLNGVEKIMAVVRDINEKKNAELQIKYRSDFEKLIFSISSAFYDLVPDELDNEINLQLGKICEFLHSDLAHIYFFGNAKFHSRLKYFWHNDKIDNLRGLPSNNKDREVIEWHTNKILCNQIINIKSIDLLPIEAEKFKQLMILQGVNSFISVPLNFQGRVIGYIGLAVNKVEREWNEDEISLLTTIGQTFINNVIRKDILDTLKESEQAHREIFNATTDAIIVHEIESGRFLDVNQAMLNMFGLTYEEAISMDPALFTFPTGQYSSENGFQQIDKTLNEGPQIFEWLTKRKDGKEFWVEISLRCAEIKGIKRVLSVVRDITERKNAEEIIKKNEEKYRLLIEGQTDLVIKLDREYNFLFVSPSYCDLFNKTELELIGTNYISPVHSHEKSISIAILDLLKEPPHTCYLEHRAFTKHGWRWISWNTKAIFNEDKKFIEIIGVGRDITYQKGVEEALRRSEDRFRSIIQQLSDIVFIIDKNGIICFDTPSVKNILGYNEGDLIGKLAIEMIHTDDQELTKQRLNDLINNISYTFVHEMRVRHIDGQWISIEAIGINLLNHPSINGLVITCRNITERKHIESRILDAIIKTEEHERERFAKNLHDDLGPLLSSIKMYINSFTATRDANKQEYIINQLNEIVKEAITTTKEVSNDLSPHILINYGLVAATDSFLKKVPSTIKAIFEHELISERLSIHIENSTYRIIKELINNSLKHSKADKIFIKLKEQNNYLSLEYSDNGIGFELSDMNKSEGMGFSNIISRAKALNSIYEFQSKPGKGFLFKIKIPIHQTQE